MKVYQLTHDGKIIYQGEKNSCLIYLQSIQGQSSNYALHWGGYDILDVNVSDAEGQEIMKSDKYHEVEVVLLQDACIGKNHNVKIRLLDGTETTANTYGMSYPNGVAAGSHAFAVQVCIQGWTVNKQNDGNESQP